MSGSQSTTDIESQIARLEENALAEEEIRRKAAELEAKEKASHSKSTRGSLPKGF